MVWRTLCIVAVGVCVASGRCVRRPPKATRILPTIQPTVPVQQTLPIPVIQPSIQPAHPRIIDGEVVQSLINTIQLFIVSDLLEETLPEKETLVTPCYPMEYEYVDYDCELPYDIIYEEECPEFVTAIKPREPCLQKAQKKPFYVNFGLNEELVLPPLNAELPCGLGYLPGGLPAVAKAYAPCPKCSGCHCSALPVCSPYSCTALATPLCPELAPLAKPIIL